MYILHKELQIKQVQYYLDFRLRFLAWKSIFSFNIPTNNYLQKEMLREAILTQESNEMKEGAQDVILLKPRILS